MMALGLRRSLVGLTAGLFVLLPGCDAARDSGSEPGIDASASTLGDGGAATDLGSAANADLAPTTWHLDQDHPLSPGLAPFSTVMHPLLPSSLWSSPAKPRPTNAFWMNLVLGSGGNRINVLPYVMKAQDQQLAFGQPVPNLQLSSAALPDTTQIMLGAMENFSSHTVSSFDLLSVTLRYGASDDAAMTVPLVSGAPYVTAIYNRMTPKIVAGDSPLARVNKAMDSPVTGSRFELTFNSGQTWVVYTSVPMTFDIDWKTSTLIAEGPWSGSVRVALQPTPADAAILDEYAGTIATGGQIRVTEFGDSAALEFDWQTMGKGPLLMMALPHHVARLQGAQMRRLSYSTIKGAMTAVEGPSWSQLLWLSPISWYAPTGIATARRADVLAALSDDKSFVPEHPGVIDTDPYLAGKQLAKLARLVLIAEELGETQTAADLRARLGPLVGAWLGGTNLNPIVYDGTWGGLVTTRGLADRSADGGNGYYNDHHLQWGYLLYAAATVAKGDAVFAALWRQQMIALVRDIASPSSADGSFTPFRVTDWYAGHSWSSGLVESTDNRSQQSSSEAVNAWYAVALTGAVLGRGDITRIGRLLGAMEIAAAQTYWQIPESSTVYALPFKANHAVGVLWSTKADFSTAMGPNKEFVYGSQMMPFTPMTESLLPTAWVTDAWPQMQSAATNAGQGWKGYMYMAHAVIDKAAGWSDAQTLSGFDDGNSKTNTLYWAATRP